ncbi:MAG: hypothetical protein IJK92_08230 [Bacteroidales bacterium]|nr:hypothetical protein [Bacteroidales bacterium]
MKKLIYLVIAVMFLSAMPEIVRAQSNDPFEQQTLKARDNTTKREKKINRKKNNEEKAQQVTPAQQPKKEQPKSSKEMTISNACEDTYEFEFVSLVGSKGAQTVKLTAKITNHGMNENVSVGRDFISYDCEGVSHNSTYFGTTSTYDMITDVPVKYVVTIPGQIDYTKTKVMPVISFNIGNCRIEMKNVPINWK